MSPRNQSAPAAAASEARRVDLRMANAAVSSPRPTRGSSTATRPVLSVSDAKSRGTQPGQHCEHTAVLAIGIGQAKRGEDVTDVAFDCLGAELQRSSDTGVGESLGHQAENLPLALRELVDQSARTAAAEQLGDDRGVHYAFVFRQAVQGVHQ